MSSFFIMRKKFDSTLNWSSWFLINEIKIYFFWKNKIFCIFLINHFTSFQSIIKWLFMQLNKIISLLDFESFNKKKQWFFYLTIKMIYLLINKIFHSFSFSKTLIRLNYNVFITECWTTIKYKMIFFCR